jgi:hypothetical protein
VTLGSDTGKGGFFPEGVNGRINSPAGYNDSANAWGGYPGNNVRVDVELLLACQAVYMSFPQQPHGIFDCCSTNAL